MIYALKIFRSPEKADGKQPQSHHWPPLVFNNFRAFCLCYRASYLCSFGTEEGCLCSLLRKGFCIDLG